MENSYVGNSPYSEVSLYFSQTFVQSLPVAVTAVVWMAFIIVVFLFPATPDPTSANMNYTVVVLGKLTLIVMSLCPILLTYFSGGTLILAVAYFYLPVYGGVHWFQGPVQTIKDMDISSQHSDVKGESDSENHGEKNST